eukprot:2814194-Amphidinium_carterae.1
MGPRVLGFANPGHWLPPRPVQPSQKSFKPALLQVLEDNNWAMVLSTYANGPVQPGQNKT